MLNVIKIEGKNQEEVLKQALEKLNSSEKEVYYYFTEQEGGLFKSKKVTVDMVTKYDIKTYIKNYINELAKNMETKINCEIKEKEEGFSVILVSENNGILIGKYGRTLSAIQTLLRQSLKKYGNFNIKINIDIANYKAKRERNIVFEVKKIAKEVMNTKIDAKLDPMNSYERRVVHTILADYPNLTTESEGIAPNRYVVIKYNENA